MRLLKKINRKIASRTDCSDDFWDLSALVHRNLYPHTEQKADEPVLVEVPAAKMTERRDDPQNTECTVIKRYINPLHDEQKRINKEAYIASERYKPENSLIHEVVLRKLKCKYNVYSGFLDDAIRYKDKQGVPCEFVEYYSYVPQYNQLSDDQLSYYFWWRYNFREGIKIQTCYSYVLLFVYELINLGKMQDVAQAQRELCDIWNIYHTEFPEISAKLAQWICDFSLIHRLQVPQNIDDQITKSTLSLKEFYLRIPKNDYKACATALIRYCTEYDYRMSKFAKGENLKIYDKYIFGAVITAVKFYSEDGAMLSALSCEDSKLIRNSFEGALCVEEQKYELEVKYCSFSRSNELRFLMADIIKYAENKIRSYIGVKSKLTVYSVSIELQRELDDYFKNTLFSIPKVSTKREERGDYDVLYDLPKSKFSLEKAKQIESESWNVTDELISAFEDDFCGEKSGGNTNIKDILPNSPVNNNLKVDNVSQKNDVNETDADSLKSLLEEYLDFINAVKNRDCALYKEIAIKSGCLPDSMVDRINEIAVEKIGDMIIEDTDSGFDIVECYADLI